MAPTGNDANRPCDCFGKAQSQLASILERMTDAFVAYDRNWHFTYVNSEAERILHIGRDKLLGKVHWDVCPFTIGNEIERLYRRAMEKREIAELEYHHLMEGLWYDTWISFKAFPSEDGGIGVFFHDITERKRVEKSLRMFRSLLDQTNDSIEVVDLETGNFLDVNERACQSCGYSREEYLSLRVADIDPGVAARPWAEIIDELKNAGSRIYDSWHRRKDGSLFPVEVNATFVHLDRDYLLAVVRDIRERKRAEESVRKLSQAIEQSPVSVVITDTSGDIEFVNTHFCETTGYSQSEVLGQNSRILKSGNTTAEEYHGLWDTITTGGIWRGEFYNRKKNGELFWEQATIAPLRNVENQITHYVAFKEDITEHKALEEQLMQIQKIESLGRLAGGVAHDFNNMLGVIMGHSEMALTRLTQGEPLFTTLKEIHKAADRSADLTRQLLAFARKQTITPRVLDLNLTVTGMLKMLRRLIGEDIVLAWIPEAEELPVRVDPSQLDQVLTNLCVNARDAIIGVGKITIETHRTRFNTDYCTTHPGFIPGNFILLAVSDNGCGMDHEVVKHIFEPFFSTKEQGKGTGLGLATVYGIVKQNGGFINVYSEPEQGTTIKIYLPQYVSETEYPVEDPRILPEVRGDETILLVEDEPSYLDIAGRMLESLGYRVLAITTPEEAADVAKEHAGKIHLLITDVIMPGMNGRELAQQLASLYPEIRILFMSGYTSDVIAHHGMLDAGVNYIQKPFSRQDLAVKVREALENS